MLRDPAIRESSAPDSICLYAAPGSAAEIPLRGQARRSRGKVSGNGNEDYRRETATTIMKAPRSHAYRRKAG
jgi:hypothetical protein